MSDKLRKEIRRVFGEWEAGRITCQGVQHWASATSTEGADVYATKIVQHLRGLGEYLITTDDIPVYLKGLELPPHEGVTHLEHEGTVFDVKARATDLKDDPFYGPHTQAILRDLG
ncbi:MAG: hypothetical protein K8I27_01055 [Planctomycetes bacterium]|nr:hypothetical protein [Planctomycetota bacterium]